jgi:hypothetical protein
MDRMYTPGPDRFIAVMKTTDDFAWYVFSALGFYPVCPGTDEYILGCPTVQESNSSF